MTQLPNYKNKVTYKVYLCVNDNVDSPLFTISSDGLITDLDTFGNPSISIRDIGISHKFAVLLRYILIKLTTKFFQNEKKKL